MALNDLHTLSLTGPERDPPKPTLQDSSRNSNIKWLEAYTRNLQKLPSWIDEYLEWHKLQRQLLQKQRNVENMRFLVMECWPWNPVCGGTADRLRSIPLMILVAHQTKRILLIKWGRPTELEEFLMPPPMGLDWRVPSWLIPHLANQSNYHAATRVDKLVHLANLWNETVVATRLQVHDHGSKYYNDHRNADEPMLRDVYRGIWNKVFVPTLPIATLIQQQLQSLQLIPGEYAAAHVRALYVEQGRKPEQIKTWSENAVNCASTLRPGGPVFFASDSTYATNMAIEYGKTKGSHVVVARSAAVAQPLHLDRDTAASPNQFYDTFVDLYLLGMSRCLTYNIGGFGKWGLLLGYNSSCGLRHQTGYGYKRDGLTPCRWVHGSTANDLQHR